MTDAKSTEEKILEAAKQEFLEKGFSGARMEAIAQRAGINKALLHYYFRNKERLFEEVFAYFFRQILPGLRQIVESDAHVLDKMDRFVQHYIDFLRRNPDLPLFIMHELRTGPKERLRMLVEKKMTEFEYVRSFIMQIAMAGARGEIRAVPPLHIVLNVVSMCVFPFVARPMLMGVTGISETDFEELLEQRKVVVADFIRAALKP